MPDERPESKSSKNYFTLCNIIRGRCFRNSRCFSGFIYDVRDKHTIDIIDNDRDSNVRVLATRIAEIVSSISIKMGNSPIQVFSPEEQKLHTDDRDPVKLSFVLRVTFLVR